MRTAALAILFSCIGAAPCVIASGLAAKPVPNVFDHKDWIGVCDNTSRCTVMGMTPDGSDTRGYIALKRDGGAAAPPSLTVAVYSDGPEPSAAPRLRLRAPGLDLTAVAGADDDEITAEIKDPAAIQAFAKLASSDAKSVQISVGKIDVAVSLSGAAAALTWMDDRQGRIGGVTALTKKGPKPAAAVPAAPPEPVFAPKGSANEIKPVNFPKALLARTELKDCEKEQLSAIDERGAWRLGPELVLWSVPCTLGAYNLASVFFLSDAKGGAIRPAPVPPLMTPESNEPGVDPPYIMINADFDPKTMVLNAFEKARGLGDCGVLRKYLWDGRAFQPLEIDYMPECRGVEADAWPALQRARVK